MKRLELFNFTSKMTTKIPFLKEIVGFLCLHFLTLLDLTIHRFKGSLISRALNLFAFGGELFKLNRIMVDGP